MEKRRKRRAGLDWLLLQAADLRKVAGIRTLIAALADHPDLERNAALTADL